MSESSDSFGSGFAAALFFGGICIGLFLLGMFAEGAWIKSDCEAFGKTQIGRNWHECKPVEKK